MKNMNGGGCRRIVWTIVVLILPSKANYSLEMAIDLNPNDQWWQVR